MSSDNTSENVEKIIVPIVIVVLQYSHEFSRKTNRLMAITEADNIATAAVELMRLRFILLAAVKRAFRVSQTLLDNRSKYIFYSIRKSTLMHIIQTKICPFQASQTASLPSTEILYKYIPTQGLGVHITIMHKKCSMVGLTYSSNTALYTFL